MESEETHTKPGHVWHNVVAQSDCIYAMLAARKYGINSYDAMGDTILINALFQRNLELVTILLDMGADPNLPSREGMLPLSVALHTDNIDIVELLLSKGADPSKLQTKSLIHEAFTYRAFKVVDWLMSEDYDFNTQDVNGNTLLHICLSLFGRDLGMTEFLCTKGTNLNIQNKDGDTPLHIALTEHKFDEAIYLIKQRADIAIKNKAGHTPLHIAKLIQTTVSGKKLEQLQSIIRMLNKCEQ